MVGGDIWEDVSVLRTLLRCLYLIVVNAMERHGTRSCLSSRAWLQVARGSEAIGEMARGVCHSGEPHEDH